MKKCLYALVSALVLVMVMGTVAYAGWENTVWLGTDLNQTGREMGYRHQDDVSTKIVSKQVNGVFTSEIQIGSTLAEFNADSGLYAMVGASIDDRLNFLFGAGFNYQNPYSPFLLSGGVKCLVPTQVIAYEIDAFYQILPPLLVHFGYNGDGNENSVFIGLGLAYN